MLPPVDKKTRDSVAVFTSPGPGALLDAAAPFLPRTAWYTPPPPATTVTAVAIPPPPLPPSPSPPPSTYTRCFFVSSLSLFLSLSLSSFVILLRASRDVLRDPADTVPASLLHSTCLPHTVKLRGTHTDLEYRDRRACPITIESHDLSRCKFHIKANMNIRSLILRPT